MKLDDQGTCCERGRESLLLYGKEAEEHGPRPLFWSLVVPVVARPPFSEATTLITVS